MRNQKNLHAFTLIELMVCCALLSILVLLSVPIFQAGGRTLAWKVAEQLQFHLEFAKRQAGSHTQSLRLCPTDDLFSCAEQWSSQYLVLNLKSSEPLTVQSLPKKVTLQYKGFPNQTFLEISSLGQLLSNGTFSVFYAGHLYYRVIVNHGGRVRIEAI